MIKIGGLEKSTLIDYPGRVAATVFLLGCNFRCPFCYSSELVLPEKIAEQPRLSLVDFFNFLGKRKGLLEGVVVCGGEPTIFSDLPHFVQKIKEMGFLVKLDTNGSRPEVLKELVKAGLLDYVAMDVKATKEKYDLVAGQKVEIGKIEESIDFLREGRVDYEFRSTIVPSFHQKEDILVMAQWLAGAKRYYLQNFRPEKTLDPELEKVKPYSQEFLFEIEKEIKRLFDFCQVRG